MGRRGQDKSGVVRKGGGKKKKVNELEMKGTGLKEMNKVGGVYKVGG